MKKITTLTVMASLVAIIATGEPLEEWNFTGDSLSGELGIYPQENFSDFFDGGDNADVPGNNTWTLNRTDDKWSWHNINDLGLSSINMDSITFAVTISSWDMTAAVSNSVSFGIYLSDSLDTDIAQFAFTSVNDGTNQNMVVDGSAGTANPLTHMSGGVVASGNTGASSIKVGGTYSWAGNYCVFWLDDPSNIIASNTLPAGVSSSDIEHMKFYWTGADSGNFLEIDQIQLYTDDDDFIPPAPPVVIVEEVLEEWNFTGGSTNSENGQPLNFAFNADTSSNDWYNVTTNGWGWDTPLTNSTTITANNTDVLILSISLNDYDFNASSNQLFGISLTGIGWAGADIRLDAVGGPQMGIQGNMGTTWASAGAIQYGNCAGGAVTYGLMLDFDGGTLGTGSYTYWTGTPGNWDVGWTWGGQTGDIDLSNATIDTIKIFIEEHVPGDRLGIDQIKVYKRSEVLQTPELLYATWLADYPGLDAATNLTDNPDNDSLSNLYEYGLGGNPMEQDTGHASSYQLVEDGGTNYFEYIHAARDDAVFRALDYHPETTTDLITGWIDAGYLVGGTNLTYADGFISITNRMPVDADQEFIKLVIEENM